MDLRALVSCTCCLVSYACLLNCRCRMGAPAFLCAQYPCRVVVSWLPILQHRHRPCVAVSCDVSTTDCVVVQRSFHDASDRPPPKPNKAEPQNHTPSHIQKRPATIRFHLKTSNGIAVLLGLSDSRSRRSATTMGTATTSQARATANSSRTRTRIRRRARVGRRASCHGVTTSTSSRELQPQGEELDYRQAGRGSGTP